MPGSENSIEIKQITDKETWDNFITSKTPHTFLQSWGWGELAESEGDKAWRLGFYKDNNLIAAAQVIKVHARRGNFLFVPHGPIFAFGKNGSNSKSEILNSKQIPNNKLQILKQLTKFLKDPKQKENVNFIRVSPLLERTKENRQIFKKLAYRPAPIYMHAENTWRLPLKKSEEDLLMDMRKNTRNLIRRAGREGVKVESGTSEKLKNDFLELYSHTAKEHGFVPFSDKFIKNEIAFIPGTKVYIARHKGQPLAGAIVVYYGASAYYHHGASVHTKIPASYLLQWTAIKEAKAAGKKYYNFWGIAADESDKNPRSKLKKLLRGRHPWHGLTLFKKGFGGFRTDYLHARDLPLNYKYWQAWAVDKARLWKRGV